MIIYHSGVSSPIQPRTFKGEIRHENIMLSFAKIQVGETGQIATLAAIELERRMADIQRRKSQVFSAAAEGSSMAAE